MVHTKESLNFSKFDLIRQIFLANFLIPALPYKITFALSYRCNLRCKYCKIWTRSVTDKLGLDKVKLILSSAGTLSWLHFTGGEIFLREDIEEILNFALENRKLAILTFPTNGVLTGKIFDIVNSLSKRLRGAKLIITCSIDGPKKIHDKLKGTDGAYDKCIETFIKLRAIDKINTYLGVTVFKDNYPTLPLLFSDLQKRIPNFTFDELHFNFASQSFFYNNTTIKSSEELINEEIYSYVDKLRKVYKDKGIKAFLENRYFKLMASYLRDKKVPVKCSALNGSCFIDPYANVYPCIAYKTKIGNLRLSGYNFIIFWKLSSKIKDGIRKTIEDKRCPGCWTPCEAYPSILHNLITC